MKVINGLHLEKRVSVIEPPLFQVILHNDDFTPMAFVIGLLQKFFYMDSAAATDLCLTVHQQGKGICGVFTKDCAEAKVDEVIDYARRHEHPLICSMEAA